MVYKDYKIDLQFMSIINFRIYVFACAFVYQRAIIYYDIFPSQLPYCIIQGLFYVHYLINNLQHSKLIPAFYKYRAIYTKDNLFILDNGVFNDLSKIFSSYYISTGYIQLFLLLVKTLQCYLFSLIILATLK